MDYYDYSTSTYAASSDVGAVAVVIWLFVILIVMAVSILMIIAMWRIFTKAGKPGWASLVPIYNMVVMMQIVGRPEWQVVLMFLPFAHIYISIVLPLDLAKSFGKTTGFGVLMIFFPAIMNPILAFGSSRYVGPVMRQQPVYGQPPQPGYYSSTLRSAATTLRSTAAGSLRSATSAVYSTSGASRSAAAGSSSGRAAAAASAAASIG